MLELPSVQSAVRIKKREQLIQWVYGKVFPDVGAFELHLLKDERDEDGRKAEIGTLCREKCHLGWLSNK